MRKAIDKHILCLNGTHNIDFHYESDMLFHTENLPLHENGMTITAFASSGEQVGFETYYSIGGGFIATADELAHGSKSQSVQVSFPFSTAEEMLLQAGKNGLSLGGMVVKNELAFHDINTVDKYVDQVWGVMNRCMTRGFEAEGILEGGLNVTRRAPSLLKKLKAKRGD
ncbi:L-serine dehydratase [Vibrio astriarenae]|nr:L-serine dehydratase [Vibrio sp. C7]